MVGSPPPPGNAAIAGIRRRRLPNVYARIHEREHIRRQQVETVGTAYRKSSGVSGAYEAIVIGSGMGGMSAASLLAQRCW